MECVIRDTRSEEACAHLKDFWTPSVLDYFTSLKRHTLSHFLGTRFQSHFPCNPKVAIYKRENRRLKFYNTMKSHQTFPKIRPFTIKRASKLRFSCRAGEHSILRDVQKVNSTVHELPCLLVKESFRILPGQIHILNITTERYEGFKHELLSNSAGLLAVCMFSWGPESHGTHKLPALNEVCTIARIISDGSFDGTLKVIGEEHGKVLDVWSSSDQLHHCSFALEQKYSNLGAIRPALLVELVELERDVREMYTNLVAVKKLEYKCERRMRLENQPTLTLTLSRLLCPEYWSEFGYDYIRSWIYHFETDIAGVMEMIPLSKADANIIMLNKLSLSVKSPIVPRLVADPTDVFFMDEDKIDETFARRFIGASNRLSHAILNNFGIEETEKLKQIFRTNYENVRFDFQEFRTSATIEFIILRLALARVILQDELDEAC